MTSATVHSIFQLAAGIGLFLFAMYLLEESIKNISGRNFKLFLQRITKNSFGAVTGGAIITAVLQSSSLVSLMVLAFVGASVFTMKNAIAIILGANLGTTIDSWLVATLGFNMNIEVVAYPAICVAGFLLILFNKRKTIKYISWLLFGFGLLFIGLAFMQTGMEAQVKEFDFSKYAEMPPLVFLFIGFLITLLVQSSSVTMALTLSGLYAGVVDFPSAAAIVLGSETGSTIKILLSAIGGNAIKKRIVLGNFLFNVFLTILSFILLKPILLLITDVFGVIDPLLGLVTFSTLINLFSVIIFIPFLDPFTKFLERFYKNSDSSAAAYIGHANVNEPITALDLFKKETAYFIHNSMLFNLELFEIDAQFLKEHEDFNVINEKKKFLTKTTDEKYHFLKQLQGELQAFYLALRTKVEQNESAELNQLISAVRSSMHAVKSMKDIGSNISNLKHSSKDIKFDFFLHNKKETEELYSQLNTYITQQKKVSFEELHSTFNTIQNNYGAALKKFYSDAQNSKVEELDLTTAINFNRELYTSNKAILMAVKDFLLEEKEGTNFNDIMVYKT